MMTLPRMMLVGVAALAVALAWSSGAQESKREQALERLDVTMALLPEDAKDVGDVTRRIELPPANPRAAADGKRPDAADASSESVGQGRDTAAEARERGREFGQDVAEQARENRDNAGKSGDAPGRPEDVPTPPVEAPAAPGGGGRPESPGRPTP
jgi:hypothetical protein